MLNCVCGKSHTITLSDDGVVHSFGKNTSGQLGLGCNYDSEIPNPIPMLPKIIQVSCGKAFTFCVDVEGFVWSFGKNKHWQLGVRTNYFETAINFPQKIPDIPRVRYVACGSEHTMIITNNSKLLVCGRNREGQLFLGLQTSPIERFQPTAFSNIIRVSLGINNSVIQNEKGELFACGSNVGGDLGLEGNLCSSQVIPTPIPNLPKNIIQFVCGAHFRLFLDSEGNVYSVGNNEFGQLGLAHNKSQYVLNKIPNIPPIQTISCTFRSSYLIDYTGNVWSFGLNSSGQLGHGDTTNRNVPTKIESLKDVQQISYGLYATHFLVKNFQDSIFCMGNNERGQLGRRNRSNILTPTETDSSYFTIWANGNTNRWDRMASKTTLNWKEHEIKQLQSIQLKIKKIKNKLGPNNNKIKQEFPQNSFESWNGVNLFLNEKLVQIEKKYNPQTVQEIHIQNQKDVETCEQELKEIEITIQQLNERKREIEENLLKAKQSKNYFEETFQDIEYNQKILKEMCSNVILFCNNEKEMNEEIDKLFDEKEFEEFDCSDVAKLLWKMDLTIYQDLFETNQINGKFITMVIDDPTAWIQLGVDKRDCYYMMFYFEMMKTPGYSKTLSPDYDFDCCVCSHATPEKTICLLQEYDIPYDGEFILKHNYCTPILTFPAFRDFLVPDIISPLGRKTMEDISKWKNAHKLHLKEIAENAKRELENIEETPHKKQKLFHDNE